MHTRFILIETSHAGNVGATARAMKVMGFDDLVLVKPRWGNVLRREETIQRASGALDVLNNARIVDSLDDALEGMTRLCATAMTPRDFGPPTVEPRMHFASLVESGLDGDAVSDAQNKAQNKAENDPRALQQVHSQKGVAFLFGSERYGMRNEDVYRCHACIRIPTNPQFGSLNLASAVQVLAYEWRMALGGFVTSEQGDVETTPELADAQQIAGLLLHWQEALTAIDFLDPDFPKKLMPRLNQLMNRAGLTQEEVHILRGIAKATLQAAAVKR
jgi:tRNA/rRNA methyltransferase